MTQISRISERVEEVARGCCKCIPQALPFGPRMYECHFAERFGDGDHIKVFAGSTEITDAFEVIVRSEGSDFGFIWRYVMIRKTGGETAISKCTECGATQPMFFVQKRRDLRVQKTLVVPRVPRV